jgi:predicted nucleotide-binding protein
MAEGGQLKLRVPRERAEEILDALVDGGETLIALGKDVGTEVEAGEWKHDYDRWTARSSEGLKVIFVGNGAAEEFDSAARLHAYNMGDSPQHRHKRWLDVIARAVNKLMSFRERLDFAEQAEEPPGPIPATGRGKNVFIVHGHDDATKLGVARFLGNVLGGADVILLEEQPDQARTIIEKFEDYAADAGYAIVLLTGDDEGRKRGTQGELQPRARQNVILELGFFIGALGRGHVALLYEEGVELPSDISGVLYQRLDPDGAWKVKLAGEMQAAGIPLDAQAVLRSV